MSDLPPPPPAQTPRGQQYGPPPVQGAQSYGFPPQKKSNLTRNVIIAAVVGFILLCGGCFALIGSAADDVAKEAGKDTTQASKTPDPKPEPTPTETSKEPEPEPTEASEEPEPTEEAEETFKMPALVGANLQVAQDELQALGSFFLTQTDATGEGRFQVLDANWKVCYQDPKAGAETSVLELVELGAVKLEEICP